MIFQRYLYLKMILWNILHHFTELWFTVSIHSIHNIHIWLLIFLSALFFLRGWTSLKQGLHDMRLWLVNKIHPGNREVFIVKTLEIVMIILNRPNLHTMIMNFPSRAKRVFRKFYKVYLNHLFVNCTYNVYSMMKY